MVRARGDGGPSPTYRHRQADAPLASRRRHVPRGRFRRRHDLVRARLRGRAARAEALRASFTASWSGTTRTAMLVLHEV